MCFGAFGVEALKFRDGAFNIVYRLEAVEDIVANKEHWWLVLDVIDGDEGLYGRETQV